MKGFLPLLALSFLSLEFSICILSVSASAQTLRERLAGPRVAAHQGQLYDGHNTLEAFESARLAGADIVELDLLSTLDGVAVVFHDEQMGLWTDCWGTVRERTLAELKSCRYRGSGRPIATFAEVLAWSKGRVVVNAEFKALDAVAPALAELKAADAYEWVYFQTQTLKVRYKAARALDPKAALQFQPLKAGDLEWALGLGDPNLVVIELNGRALKPEAAALAHAAGKKVSTNAWERSWTWEWAGAACAWAWKAGADIAVSNRPEGCVKERPDERD